MGSVSEGLCQRGGGGSQQKAHPWLWPCQGPLPPGPAHAQTHPCRASLQGPGVALWPVAQLVLQLPVQVVAACVAALPGDVEAVWVGHGSEVGRGLRLNWGQSRKSRPGLRAPAQNGQSPPPSFQREAGQAGPFLQKEPEWGGGVRGTPLRPLHQQPGKQRPSAAMPGRPLPRPPTQQLAEELRDACLPAQLLMAILGCSPPLPSPRSHS